MIQTTSARRRGAMGVMALIILPILLGMAALAIDVGYIFTSVAELQNAVDAGALAGASALPTGDTEVRARVVQVAGENYVSGESVAVPVENIEIGSWESVLRTFTPITGEYIVDESGGRIYPNAVRVVGRRGQLPLMFATVLGHNYTNLEREAIAVMDAGRCLGVWGLNGIRGMGNIMTDSYDSRNGPYGPDNVNQNGDVCSNNDIRLGGSFEIHGDAMCGPGHEVVISGSPHGVWGVEGKLSEALEAPVVDASEARVNNDNDTAGTNRDGLTDQGYPLVNDELNLNSGDNLTLWGGTYYFTSVRMNTSSSITIEGPTVIYIDGDANITGTGIVNTSQDPKTLMVYCTGASFDLGGSANFYGTVVAPYAEVKLRGTSEFYGMIIADTIDAAGTAVIHVDEPMAADLISGSETGAVPVLVK